MPGRHPGWGSAYPRQTTYTRPSHPNGLGIKQAVNEVAIGAPGKHSIQSIRSTLGIMDARAAAANQVYHGASAQAQAYLNRRSIVDDATSRFNEVHGLRQNRGNQQELKHYSDLSDRPDALPPRGMVGSTPQVGNPVATANKQNAEQSMDDTMDKVLQSPSIGGTPTLIIPKWETKTGSKE